MTHNDCIFCSIAAGDLPCAKVYEDASVIGFLDIGPINEGHTLLVPKSHYERLDECPAEDLAAVMACVGGVARAIVAAVDADGYNLLCNTGRVAGQAVGHVHFHVIPRHKADGVFARWPAGKYAAGRAEEIAAKIREKL